MRINLLFRLIGKEGDGFLLLYKRCEAGRYQWPGSVEEAKHLELDQEQLQDLLNGFAIVRKCTIEGDIHPTETA